MIKLNENQHKLIKKILSRKLLVFIVVFFPILCWLLMPDPSVEFYSFIDYVDNEKFDYEFVERTHAFPISADNSYPNKRNYIPFWIRFHPRYWSSSKENSDNSVGIGWGEGAAFFFGVDDECKIAVYAYAGKSRVCAVYIFSNCENGNIAKVIKDNLRNKYSLLPIEIRSDAVFQ